MKEIIIKITPEILRDIAQSMEEGENACKNNAYLAPDRCCFSAFTVEDTKVCLCWFPGQPSPE